MKLYADDPDVHQTYPITAKQGDLSFEPVVHVTNVPEQSPITAEWLGTPGLARDLKVPLAGLPAGSMLFLRLLVPDENDIELGYVVLS